MKTYITRENQTMFDIAIQELGNVEGLYDILTANNLTTDTILSAGQPVVIPNSGVSNESATRKVKELKLIFANYRP
jgi:hypothetical protein